MIKGEIFIACDKKKHPHPIVFLESTSSEQFNACILSTKLTNGNIPMLKEHFLENDEHGIEYEIVFKNSHLVPHRIFEKNTLWLNSLSPKGKLSKTGVEFIEKYTNGISPEYHPIPIWKKKSVERGSDATDPGS